MAGELAAGALLGTDPEPSRTYSTAVQADVSSELALSARARGTFFSRIVTRFWIDVLRESPRVRAMVLDVVIGAIGYYHLRRRGTGPNSATIRGMNLGLPELLVILAIIILVFGANRLPDLGRGIGRAIKNFKEATTDGREKHD